MNATLGRLRFPLLSLIIAGILVVQLIAGFRHTNKWFPFMWYPMYGYPNFEGDRIQVRHSIYAVTPDGKRHYIRPKEDLKVDFWLYDSLSKWLIMNKMIDAAPGLRHIKTLYPDLVRIEVEDYPLIITKDGPRPAPRKILNTISRSSIDELTK